LSAIYISVATSDGSISSEIEMSSSSVQTPKYLSANILWKLKLHEMLVEEIQLRKEFEDLEKDLLHKVNTLSLQLAERYAVDYCLRCVRKI